MLPLRMLGLLVLMLSLRDADSICPNELNPLILDAPKVIVQFGESVEVNCTSTEEDHDGMYWSLGDTDSPMQYDSYISWLVSLSEWNVTAECRIKLNDTHECSKELEITMYQNPMVTVFPIKTTAVEGTLYELQCDITDVAPVQNLVVRWYKDNQTIKTDLFTNTTRTPVSESSALMVNISRAEHGAQFRCEAQLDFWPDGPQLPVHSDTHTVSVHYAPEFKNKTEDVFVYEGHDVTLNCDAEGYPPPHFNWLHDGGILPKTNNLTITQVNTSATYNCSATNYLGSITKQIHVHVLKIMPAAPAAITTPEPSTPRVCPLVLTPAEMVVRFGDPASVNCSTSAAGIVKMGWEAKYGAIASSGPAVTWRVDKVEDWTIKPVCFINLEENDMVHQCSVMMDITLYKTPDIVSVSALNSGPMMEGTEYELKCDILKVAPLQKLKVTWYRGNETVLTQMFNDTSKGPVNKSSTLSVTAERDYNGAHFRCKAELHLGPNGPKLVPTVTSPPYMAVVHYKPLIKACPGQYAGVEHEFSVDKLSCQADGNPPPPIIQWYYKGKLINASEPLTRTQSGKYTAEVTNSLGRSNTSVDITIEYGPTFTCNDRYEVEWNGKLQCEPEGEPKPNITWWKDTRKMAYPRRWTKHDSGVYILEATNKHGTATRELRIDVLYAPEFKEGTYNEEVNLDANVTLDCSAEGNPPPEIRWNYTSAVNVRETTRGHQKSISVTGATSTNAGVYICVATNKVRSVTRSVTLIMKGKTSTFPLRLIWWLLVLLLVVIILILILAIIVQRWKKHGRYSFVPDKANEGSDIPMTPQSNGVQA